MKNERFPAERSDRLAASFSGFLLSDPESLKVALDAHRKGLSRMTEQADRLRAKLGAACSGELQAIANHPDNRHDRGKLVESIIARPGRREPGSLPGSATACCGDGGDE